MIDYKMLEHICGLPTKDFAQYGEVTETPAGIMVFQDNGADILACAHLDSVQGPAHFELDNHKYHPKVYSPTLDDRLGAYIILDLLPRLGVKFDVLLTEGEETGNSTAKFFKTDKQYNWLFQFDREGTDAVLYRYEARDYWAKQLSEYWNIGRGSFSDISYLEHLKCKGVNIGCSYYNYHSLNAYCKIKELQFTIQKFLGFYAEHKHIHFPHEPVANTGWYGHNSFFDDDFPEFDENGFEHIVCQNCGSVYYHDETEYDGVIGEQAYSNGFCFMCYDELVLGGYNV